MLVDVSMLAVLGAVLLDVLLAVLLAVLIAVLLAVRQIKPCTLRHPSHQVSDATAGLHTCDMMEDAEPNTNKQNMWQLAFALLWDSFCHHCNHNLPPSVDAWSWLPRRDQSRRSLVRSCCDCPSRGTVSSCCSEALDVVETALVQHDR